MPHQNDRVQREIEELLDRLDNFVPEERFLSKVKSRRKERSGPGLFSRIGNALAAPFKRVTLGHIMLLGLGLVVTAWLIPGIYGDYRGWASLGGFLLMAVAFVLSLMGWDARRTLASGRVEKRWRGKTIEYDTAAGGNPVSNWLRRRGRR